jgi:hypothetical protein
LQEQDGAQQPEPTAAPSVDRAALLQEAIDSLAAAIRNCPASSGKCLSCEAKAAAIRELRRIAEAQCGGAS